MRKGALGRWWRNRGDSRQVNSSFDVPKAMMPPNCSSVSTSNVFLHKQTYLLVLSLMLAVFSSTKHVIHLSDCLCCVSAVKWLSSKFTFAQLLNHIFNFNAVGTYSSNKTTCNANISSHQSIILIGHRCSAKYNTNVNNIITKIISHN